MSQSNNNNPENQNDEITTEFNVHESNVNQSNVNEAQVADAEVTNAVEENSKAAEQFENEETRDDFAAFGEAVSAEEEISILRNQLEKAQAEIATLTLQSEAFNEANNKSQDMQDKYLRAKADLDNYRRRAAQDVERARSSGVNSVVLAVVPVYDDLTRALDAGTKDPSTLIPGIEVVRETLKRNLAAIGIQSVGTAGEAFDPTYHEALSSIPASNDEEKGTIAQVFQIGFVKDEKLIRPAQVVVYQD